MLAEPYECRHSRPFHTAEDGVCGRWRSLFLTVLHFRAQACLEDLKNPNFPPHPKQNKQKGEAERRGKKKEKRKTTLMGPFMQIVCSAFLFLKLVGK